MEDVPSRHYLDWAATAIPERGTRPVDIAEIFGNPSSPHTEGRLAKEALENARTRCARVLGVESEKLYFTSGGTESNALVLHSFLLREGKGQLLYSDIEHPSVRENCRMLTRFGLSVNCIGVERDGRVTTDKLSLSLEKKADTRFVAIMGVNNETGALMDTKALLALLRSQEARTGLPVHLHCDMVQALGKVPIDIGGIDSASFSAHKLGGQRGIGLLYLKKKLDGFYAGGGQEGGIRPGTENTAGAVAFADLLERRASPEIVRTENGKAAIRFKYLIGELNKIGRCTVIPEDRTEEDPRFSPWIIQVRFRGVPGPVMARALDNEGIAVSTGSACSSNSAERPVLAAMGVDERTRLEGLRISQGWTTDTADFDALLAGIEKVLSFL